MIDPRNYFAPFIGPPGLQIVVDGGVVLISGAPVTVVSVSVVLAPNTTTFVYLNTSTGIISSITSAFPSTNCYPIAKVVTSTSGVLNLTDSRPDVGGSGGGGGVTSLNSLTGALTIVAGTNISVTPSGSNITIANTAPASPNFSINETPSGLVNSSNVTFTLAHTPVAGTVAFYRNGVRQQNPGDYSISSSTITTVLAPGTGDIILADYQY